MSRAEEPPVDFSDLDARRVRMRAARASTRTAGECVAMAAREVAEAHGAPASWFAPAVWAMVRAAVRASMSPALDRLEWRALGHHVNGHNELIVWRGGRARHRWITWAQRRHFLEQGRHFPIAGPAGRLP